MVAKRSRFIPSSQETQTALATIRACIDARIPYIMVGPPGNGKTSIIDAITAEMGYDIVVVIGSQLHAVEASGLPIVVGQDTDQPTTVKALPDWFRKAQQNPKTAIVFDEWLNTPAATQAALLVFIQQRILGNVKLPDETVILMAGNPIESGANGQPLTQPMANRIVHGVWNPPVEDWLEGMTCNWNEEDASERLTQERLRIATFIRSNPELLDRGPQNDLEQSGAHPSRRSWENLARLLSNTDPDQIAVRSALILGTVGEEAFAAFSIWDANFRLPNLEEVLEDPESVDWVNEEADRIYGILSMAIGATTPDNAIQVGKLIETVGRLGNRRDIGAGMVTPFIGKTAGLDPAARMEIIRNLSFIYKDILQASGMLAAA